MIKFMKVGLTWQKMSEHLFVHSKSQVEGYVEGSFDLFFPASVTVSSMQ